MRYFYTVKTDDVVVKTATSKKNLDLDDCYSAIDCQWVEMVPCKFAKKSYTMIVNEEGKLEGRYPNAIATAIYNNPYDTIVGHAVITKTSGWGTFDDAQAKVFEDALHEMNPYILIMEA